MGPKVAVVTNCYPPRFGGIETFVHQLALSLPADKIVVIAPADAGSVEFDHQQPFPVVRLPQRNIFPSRSVAKLISEIAKKHNCRRLLFTELVPLGLMSSHLKAAGFERIVSLSHGAELAWTKLPIARSLVRRAVRNTDAVTYLADDFRDKLQRATGAAGKLHKLSPGVDTDEFSPLRDGSDLKTRLGLQDRQIVLCVSRLVPRKGQDKLIQAMPMILRECPNAALLIVGTGPNEQKLQAMRHRSSAKDRIWLLGEVCKHELPAHYAAADVFAMPCRSRFGGLELEGFGIVYLEAASSGLPVVAGRSGGAVEAVQDGVSGLLVDGTDHVSIAQAITRILKDNEFRQKLGKMGRQRVLNHSSWDVVAENLSALLWPENDRCGG